MYVLLLLAVVAAEVESGPVVAPPDWAEGGDRWFAAARMDRCLELHLGRLHPMV